MKVEIIEAITLKQAADFTKGTITQNSEIKINAVSTNSKEIPENCIFIPIKGERFDGHDFIEMAVQNGAVAVISHKDIECSVPVIMVSDTRKALLDLAGGYRDLFHIPVVGVTGSVGKTTTKEMIASVVKEKFRTLKTEGNFNNEIGMPLTVFGINKDTEAAVLEMGMSNFGEISKMTVQAKPTVAVITNIGVSHIEFLGSREGICKAKLEILEGLKKDGVAVLCGDEPLLWDKRDKLNCKTLYFGIENKECDITAVNILLEDDKVSFTVCMGEESFPVVIHTAGKHNVLNALASVLVGKILGLSNEQIINGLDSFKNVGMRQNIFSKNGFTIFADCYNASPDSVEASLAVLKELSVSGKRIAVLGGMRELGSYLAEGHERCGKKAAECCDKLYLYGEGAEYYAKGAKAFGMSDSNIHIFDTHEELAYALKKDSSQGDALLFKGSRSMKMEHALELFLGESLAEQH